MTAQGIGSSKLRTALETAGLFITSSTFAVLATGGLAALADQFEWCCVHGWALMHGTGGLVLMLFGLIGFHLFSFVGLRTGALRPFNRFGLWPHVAYLGGALGMFIFTEHFMWIGLFVGITVVVAYFRGTRLQPLGLGVVGLIASILSVAYWSYLTWLFAT